MEEMVYPDGVSFENSIAYHRLVLELFAYSGILCRRNEVELSEAFWVRLEKMFEFVMHYTRPDGKVPMFGDSDDGRFFIFTDYYDWDRWDHRYLLSIGAVLFERADFKAAAEKCHEEVLWFSGEEGVNIFGTLLEPTLSLTSRAFPNGGIYILRHEDIYVAVNAARTGVNGLGPHKHNDTLSFELCVDHQPIIVDSGTYCYTGDPVARRRFQSTAAHNTVMVDGVEQNDLDGVMFGLKVNQVHPKVNRWESNEDFDLVDAEHTGYCRLDAPVTHRRIVRLEKKERLCRIRDLFTGHGVHKFAWYFHLEVGLEVEQVHHGTLRIYRSGISKAALMDIAMNAPYCLDIETGWISFRYGVKKRAKVLALSTEAVCPVETSFVLSTVQEQQGLP